MAELLVMRINKSHPNPDKDQRGSYKLGDVVVVKEDGHEWGKEEHPATSTNPMFFLVKIPGVPAEKVEQFIAPETAVDPETGDETTVRRRRWNVRANDVPLAIRNQLLATGEVTVTWPQIRNYVQNKLTLETAPDTL